MNNDKSYKDNYNPTALKVLKEDNCLPFAGKYGIGILLKKKNVLVNVVKNADDLVNLLWYQPNQNLHM
ncbi:hypothetical protein OUZ56_005851 [Daphnia magna]|uniref:Uncharacterized protein n=1 Tax=Daphnia magna TaxID=35525 RepID=A0ABQ9YTY0_9CRUS|nr:hypothetical protein OUZ56_005851 [Daphnia magna]